MGSACRPTVQARVPSAQANPNPRCFRLRSERYRPRIHQCCRGRLRHHQSYPQYAKPLCASQRPTTATTIKHTLRCTSIYDIRLPSIIAPKPTNIQPTITATQLPTLYHRHIITSKQNMSPPPTSTRSHCAAHSAATNCFHIAFTTEFRDLIPACTSASITKTPGGNLTTLLQNTQKSIRHFTSRPTIISSRESHITSTNDRRLPSGAMDEARPLFYEEVNKRLFMYRVRCICLFGFPKRCFFFFLFCMGGAYRVGALGMWLLVSFVPRAKSKTKRKSKSENTKIKIRLNSFRCRNW
jgi:hypothetical protein